MNNVFVYIETEGGEVADVGLELLTKGRELADRLGCKLEALALGHELKEMDKIVGRYGADTLWLAGRCGLRSVPHPAPYGGGLRYLRRGETPDRPVRCDAGGARPRSARLLHAAQRADGRLYEPRHRRPYRCQERPVVREPALSDSSCLRRQHHRHHRQSRPSSANGDRPRGRDAQGRAQGAEASGGETGGRGEVREGDATSS